METPSGGVIAYPGMRHRRLIALAVVVALAAIGWGGYAWWQSTKRVATDDAYVEGSIVVISAKVSGHVAEVHMDDNRAVKAGDLLLRIDPRDYQARRDQARAAVAVAQASQQATRSETQLTRETTSAQAEEARATLESARVAEQGAESAVTEARATVEAKRAAMAALAAEVTGAESTLRQNAREKERMRTLLQGGFVSQRDFDQAEMSAATASATLEATRRRLNQAEKEAQQAEAALASRIHAVSQARQRINEARAALGRVESQRRQVTVKEAEIERAVATLSQAQADLAFAELQLQYTEVRTPADGVIAKKSVEVGPGGADGPAPARHRAPARGLGPRQLQGDPARTREAGHARRGGDRHLPGPDLPRHGGLAQRGHRSALLASAARERHRQLGQGRAAGPGQDPAGPQGLRQSAHPPGRHVRVRRHPGEVPSRAPRESVIPAIEAAGPISAARKWAITLSVMVVAFMQVLDTSVTNVVLPHLQGSLSAGLEEVSWVITSYLAANAIIIPATGWLAGVLGRKRFFLICCVLFTVSSVLSGMAPNLTFLVLARIAQGIGGGPIIPLSQAILWEIFPLGQRGLAMAVWGVGFMMGPIIGPDPGRLHRGQLVVAVDLLHQPPGRGWPRPASTAA